MSTEFNTEGSLFLELDETSAQSARKDLESELASEPISIEADVQTTGGTGGSGIGGGSSLRDGLDDQSMELGEISSSWEENLTLNETRNELLRELVDMAESGQLGGSSGGGRGIIGGLLAGGVGLALMGGVLGKKLIDFLGDFSFPDVEIPDVEIPNIPSELPVDVPNSIPVNVPDSIPVDVPDRIPVDIPNIDPLTIKRPDWVPIPLKKPDWLPGNDNQDTGSNTDTGTPVVDPSPSPTGPGGYIDAPGAPSPSPGPTVPRPNRPGGHTPAPTPPPSDDDTPTKSPNRPGIIDEIITGVTANAALTKDAIEGGAGVAEDNAGAIAAGGGIAALAKGLASRFPASGAGLAVTDDFWKEHTSSPLEGKDPEDLQRARWASWMANQSNINLFGGGGEDTVDSSTLDPRTGTVTEQPSSPSAVQESFNESTNRRNHARESSRQKVEATLDQTVELDTSRLESQLSKLNRELMRRIQDLESQIEDITNGGRF